MIESANNGNLEFAVCLVDPEPEAADRNATTKKSRKAPKTIVIGLVGIWDENEVGFIFNREYWGKGYASEAVRAVLEKFWAEHPSDEALVKADVDPRNESCLRALQRLGFVEVGRAEKTYETHIGWCDSVYLEARKQRPSN